MGAIDNPLHPLSIAIGCEATFVARAIDTEIKHLGEVLKRAAEHQGTAFVEVYQNCNVFNDGAFAAIRGKGGRENQIRLEHGEPIRFGAEGERCVVRDRDGGVRITDVAEVGAGKVLVHDAQDANPSRAFTLAHLAEQPTGPTPIGVFRAVRRPVYAEPLTEKLEAEHGAAGERELDALLRSGDTWTVD